MIDLQLLVDVVARASMRARDDRGVAHEHVELRPPGCHVSSARPHTFERREVTLDGGHTCCWGLLPLVTLLLDLSFVTLGGYSSSSVRFACSRAAAGSQFTCSKVLLQVLCCCLCFVCVPAGQDDVMAFEQQLLGDFIA
jgi:hypothetical protein